MAATATATLTLAALLWAHSPVQDPEPTPAEKLVEAEQQLAAAEQEHGAESAEFAAALTELLNARFYAGDVDGAIETARRNLDLLRRLHGEEHADVGQALTDMGVLLSNQRRFDQATPFLEQALAVREKVLGPDHPDTADSLNNLGVMRRVAGDYEGALELYRRGFAVRSKTLAPDDPELAESHSSLASVLGEVGRFDDAADHYAKALAIRETHFGVGHRKTADTLRVIGELQKKQGQFEQARRSMERCLEILRREYGADHLECTQVMHALGELFDLTGSLQESLAIHRQSLQIRIDSLGPDHWMTGNSHYQVGSAWLELHEPRRAAEHLDQSLRISEATYGKGHRETLAHLGALAGVYSALGDPERAIRLRERALRSTEQAYGLDSTMVINALANLGHVWGEVGAFEKARPLVERALDLQIKAYGEDHPDSATLYNNLGWVADGQGDWQSALEHYRRSLKISERLFGDDHPDLINSMNNIGFILKSKGRHDEALELYQQALDLAEKTYGVGHLATAVHLGNQATLLDEMGRSDEAMSMGRRGLEIREKSLGQNHPDFVSAINNQACRLMDSARHPEADAMFRAALERSSVRLADHPIHGTLLHNAGLNLLRAGEFARAAGFLRQALVHTLRHLDLELPTMSEAARFQFLQVKASPVDFLHALAELPEGPAVEDYHLYCRWKGKVTRLMRSRRLLEARISDPQIQELNQQLRQVSEQLARLVMAPLAAQDADHAERLATLRADRLELEQRWNRSLQLDEVMDLPSVAEMQAALPADAALVDFHVAAEVFAWVLRPNGVPHLVALGQTGPLRESVHAHLSRSGVRGARPLQAAEDDAAKVLWERLWLPIAKEIGDATTVFLSPDDFLGELPFGILADPEAFFLIESRRFHYLSDATRLVESATASAGDPGSMLVVGDVNYFARSEDVASAGTASAGEGGGGVLRSRMQGSWTSLPATRDEIQALQDLHDYVLEWSTPMERLTGKDATEEALRAAIPDRAYIHIATHGYFEPENLPSLLVDAAEAERAVDLSEQRRAVGLMPGLLSGLVLAGVNAATNPDRHDGYLSAEEIQHLDLDACRLVVLSACETALGSPRAGEGLMSLRRALQVAGADRVVSSLWKVDDRATAQLMKDFYTQLWQRGMSPGEALHQARLRMLRRNRAEFQDARPATWGAFVLSGAWR